MSDTTTPTIYEIPLIGAAQKFLTTLNGIQYNFDFRYHAVTDGGWTLDISLPDGTELAAGLPLVTGENILQQYAYLGIGGTGAILFVYTDADPDAVPTYENLGTASHLLFVGAET